jgi:nucleotide-binding universal stress UspA family protein
MYDGILFPTDGSGDANRALEHAIEFAERFGATLHVVFVIDDRAGERGRERQQGRGEAALTAIDDAAREYGLDVTTTVREGRPAEELLAYAESEPVDIVVMGTHGTDGEDRDRRLLGGVTDAMLRQSDVPVVTVSP